MGSDASTVTNFCACFLKYDSTGKPMVGSQDFGCFLRLRLKVLHCFISNSLFPVDIPKNEGK